MKSTVSKKKAAERQKRFIDGGQPVAEPGAEDDAEGEEVVHKRCRAQLLRAVMAYHQRVGKAQDDDTQLPDDDGQAQAEKQKMFVAGPAAGFRCLFHNHL